jgi:energy-coupling factor transport system substrate-specific component
MMKRPLSATIFAIGGLIGLLAFTYPLVIAGLASNSRLNLAPQATDSTLVTMVLLLICLGVLLTEVQGQAVNAKVVAALGVLVAVASVLRLLETAVPGPGGFSPIFVPIILAGYVYGPRFGFLMGTLTLFTSALLTGGIGPWLPYQMFAAGWVGMSAGWLPKIGDRRIELTILAAFAFAWGVLYGFILNLYFWPLMTGDPSMSWLPGTSFGETIARYGAFYLASSFAWDVARAIGNLLLMLAIGLPAVRALGRFKDRLTFEIL